MSQQNIIHVDMEEALQGENDIQQLKQRTDEMKQQSEENFHSDGQVVAPESLIQPKSSARKKFMGKKHSN